MRIDLAIDHVDHDAPDHDHVEPEWIELQLEAVPQPGDAVHFMVDGRPQVAIIDSVAWFDTHIESEAGRPAVQITASHREAVIVDHD